MAVNFFCHTAAFLLAEQWARTACHQPGGQTRVYFQLPPDRGASACQNRRAAMPTFVELQKAQNLLDLHRGGRVLAVTITPEEWKRATDLGLLHPRSKELEAIDKALKEYHLLGKTEPAFIKLKTAFDNWIRSQERGGKAWTQSDRNKSGMVSKLHEQVTLVEAGRSVRQMGNTEDWEARKARGGAEREAMKRLFLGRTLVFKHAAWKTKLNTAVNAGVLPAVSIGMAVKTAGQQLMWNGGQVIVVPPQTVYEACYRIC